MILSTCANCGGPIEETVKHICETLPELTTAKHIQYFKAHAQPASEGTNEEIQPSRS